MLLALSGGQKLGILLVAGLFIGFALASSFLFPRSRPDFPGHRGLKLFVALTLVLFVSMLTAVAVLARESEEEGTHEQAAGETTAEESGPASDAEAGKAVFSSAGCGGCHTLEDAGSSGQVGPNLDDSRPDHALVVERVTNGQGVMPSFAGELSGEQIQDVAAYVVEATGAS
jgi:mono/diheme cytochrome c family protein